MDSSLKPNQQSGPGGRSRQDSVLRLSLAAVLLTAFANVAFAQVTVKTLGGGRLSARGSDAGFVDGNTLQNSQFNHPAGVTIDTAGVLFVADKNNGAVRKLDLVANRASTLLQNLNQPVAVAVNADHELFIVTQGDGFIRKFDRFNNVSILSPRLNSPTAVTFSGSNTLYVTEAGGAVVRVDTVRQVRELIRAGLNRPTGIAVLNSGLLAVSDTGNHRILFLDPASGMIVTQVGTGFPGFRDGSFATALFNEPHHLAKAPNGSIVVADRLNHRVRLVNPDGSVSTLYGKSPSTWEGPECVNCTPIILPGWLDGSADFAEAREPFGVAVSRDGKLYATETYYHLIREISGLSNLGGNGDTSTNVVVLPPVISPDSGYFPLGQPISVFNPNTNGFFSTAVYYTTDGSAPTTNSLRLELQNNIGTIFWRDATRDLTSLRLIAYVGTQPSVIVRGQSARQTEIGVTRDLTAGIGSTVIIPISVNVRPSDQLKSLQFRVEITPENSTSAPIPESFRPLSVTSNDFVRVVTSDGSGASRFSAVAYGFGQTRGYAINFIGPDSNFSVKDFGVVAMFAVPIPIEARPGNRYVVQVIQPSGTSDAAETRVPISAMEPRFIVADAVTYLVGDTSPAVWYNADSPGLGFGDGILDNSDVNNVFAASLGARVPYRFSDLYDAMDAYPEDTAASAGGDGLIRFLDWQVVLRRALGIDPVLWKRTWSSSGTRVTMQSTTAETSKMFTRSIARAPGTVWQRQALISASHVISARAGSTVDVPIDITVAAGSRVAGLAFRSTVTAAAGSPALTEPVQFVSASGQIAPMQTRISPTVLLCGWPIVPSPSFQPAVEGKHRLGYMRITVPTSATVGHSYSISFANADGAPDLQTQYDLETRTASIWVDAMPDGLDSFVSDEWTEHFFASAGISSARANADPDQDGVPNWAEYLAGTDPTRAESQLRFESAAIDPRTRGLGLRWLSAPGKLYSIEASSDLQKAGWRTIASGIPGTGQYLDWKPSDSTAGTGQFFRLKVSTSAAANSINQ
jgi:sugar lactone lactonase YvrE